MRNILIILLAVIALAGCDLFKLREPGTPSEMAQWNDPASTVALALQNLQFAYEDSRNVVNYSRIFTDNFAFYFASQDMADFGMPSQWGRSEEQDMLLNLHGRYSNIKVEFQALDTPDEIGSNEAKLYRAYTIKAKAQGVSGEIALAEGHTELHYLRAYDRWNLLQWKDYRASGARTWGRLKYENY